MLFWKVLGKTVVGSCDQLLESVDAPVFAIKGGGRGISVGTYCWGGGWMRMCS